ncbi:MAG: CHAD domain-containing protein [Gemmatimonadota bacterium]|nr:CHAD domain-containing protein [Gemmatimonadota bacterium]
MTSPNLADLIPDIIRPRLERLENGLIEMDDEPEEETTHQLRVSARRVDAALNTFAAVMATAEPCRVRPIRRVERRLGNLRDLDVLGQAMKRDLAEAGDDELRAALGRALDRLKEGRADAIRRARRAVARPALRRVRERLADWLREPRFGVLGRLPAAAVVPDLYLPMLGSVLIHPGWGLAGTPAPDLEEAGMLHALRRRLKALRYRIECMADWFGSDAGVWLDELHAMQDTLGSWHDDGVLLGWLARAQAPDQAIDRVRERARAALAPWEGWRQRYLDPVERQRMRATLIGFGRVAP